MSLVAASLPSLCCGTKVSSPGGFIRTGKTNRQSQEGRGERVYDVDEGGGASGGKLLG
jgi:hypothetical protein